MQHPDEGLIHAWLDGELDAAEAARVEALVASDPAWAEAAAEARGLMAASARIVGALDRVPANVIPKAAPAPRRTVGPWVWRAAAALVLVAGSAVVLERGTPTKPTEAKKAAPAALAGERPDTPAVAAEPRKPAAVAANAPSLVSKSITSTKDLGISKQNQTSHDKDVLADAAAAKSNAAAAAAPAGAVELRANRVDVAGGAAARQSQAAAALAAPVAPRAQGLALEKTTRLRPLCFEQRQPLDSAGRIIRLEAGALEDSIRLEKLTRHGDTLAAVNGPLIAILSRCPAP